MSVANNPSASKATNTVTYNGNTVPDNSLTISRSTSNNNYTYSINGTVTITNNNGINNDANIVFSFTSDTGTSKQTYKATMTVEALLNGEALNFKQQ